jgi:cytoskeletal protein CcmA (bactofilin family)
MFGRKDSMKEFEQMQKALKPAERFSGREGTDEPVSGEPSGVTVTPMTSNATTASLLMPKAATPPVGEQSSVVSLGSSWQGSLKIEGSVRVEGQITGEIDAKETVFVAESAQVDAKVRAAFVVIAGEFQGEVHCTEKLEITPTGRVRAELTTKSLIVHEGAFLEGQIRMSTPPGPGQFGKPSTVNAVAAGPGPGSHPVAPNPSHGNQGHGNPTNANPNNPVPNRVPDKGPADKVVANGSPRPTS